jgi:dihydroxyacid dehydratase/phosphogluconate dehydratase
MTSSNDLTAGSRLRSAQWYAGDDRNAYIHRAWMRRGVPGDAFTGCPHIAIANTASDLRPVNTRPQGRLRQRRAVTRR